MKIFVTGGTGYIESLENEDKEEACCSSSSVANC